MLVYSPTGSSAHKSSATAAAPMEPNATATARSGRVRRHNSVEIATRATTIATAGQARSSRSRPSSSAVGTSTATSTQSRHTRAGGAGARGSAHSDRAAVLIEPAYGTRAHGGIGRKYESQIARSAGGSRAFCPMVRAARSRHARPAPVLAARQRSFEGDTRDVTPPVPSRPLLRPPAMGRDRVLARRVRARDRRVGRLRPGARGLVRGTGRRLTPGDRAADCRRVGSGRAHRPAGRDATRRARDVLRLG